MTNGASVNRQVIRGDRRGCVRGRLLPVAIVLDRLRSAFNVGNIFRVAEALRLREVVTGGYTATPPHGKLAKTARGCDERVACRHYDQTIDAVRALKAEGYRVWGVETIQGANSVWQFECIFPAAFVFGNEALGISSRVIAECDCFVKLPMFGEKNSINVANAAAVVLYEVARQATERLGAAPNT